MMNINETILLAKTEKDINNIWESNYNEISKGLDFENLNEVDILSIKYSKIAEELRQYNYKDKLLEYLNSKEVSPSTVKFLRENVENALMLTNSENVECVLEGYRNLTTLKVMLEAGREFMDAYEKGGSHLDNYLKKKEDKWVKKGMKPEDAREKARVDYERRATNILHHTDRVDNPSKRYPAQVKKY